MNFGKYDLSPEEERALEDTLLKIRVEKAREEAINFHRDQFFEMTVAAIDAIGTEEVKRLLRDLLNDLRRGLVG